MSINPYEGTPYESSSRQRVVAGVDATRCRTLLKREPEIGYPAASSRRQTRARQNSGAPGDASAGGAREETMGTKVRLLKVGQHASFRLIARMPRPPPRSGTGVG